MAIQTKEELLQSVKDAVRATLAALGGQRPGEKLAGYALLTDDSLATLTYMAITERAVASGGGDDLLFSPTDWPYDYEAGAFESASAQLAASEAASESDERVDDAFALLVQALADLRGEEIFPPTAFLSVLSTDPSPHLEALESASVERLNQPDLVEARKRFLERWAG